MRAFLIGFLCVGFAAIGWLLWDDAPARRASPPSPPVAQPVAPGPRRDIAAPAITAPPERPAAPAPIAPSFDIVRVSPEGSAVMAGRAAPGSEIVILDGETELGRTRADQRGEWTFLPPTAIAPGGRQLRLVSVAADGARTEAASTLVLVVPERGRDIAGRAVPRSEAASSSALILLAPASDAAEDAPRVLMAPVADVAEVSEVRRAESSVSLAAAPAAASPTAVPAAALPARAVPAVPSGPPQGGVSVDAVDYAQGGEVQFAGRAAPGGSVRLYLDNRHVGDAVADQAGRWALAPEAAIQPGQHDLRVDHVGPGGRVIARAEMPFQRAETPPEGLREGQVVVQPGQNLWRIARATYGRGVRFTVIYQANRDVIRDPARIWPGQVFTVPPGSASPNERPRDAGGG